MVQYITISREDLSKVIRDGETDHPRLTRTQPKKPKETSYANKDLEQKNQGKHLNFCKVLTVSDIQTIHQLGL